MVRPRTPGAGARRRSLLAVSATLVGLAGLQCAAPPPPDASIVRPAWERVQLGQVPVTGRAEDLVAFRGEFWVGGFSQAGPILLRSVDGIGWRSVAVGGQEDDWNVMGLAADSDAMIALLEQPDTSTVSIRRSTDGRSWAGTDDRLLSEIRGVRAIDVEWLDGEFVALASRPSGGDDPTVETIIARSRDGVGWTVERSPDLTLDVARAPIGLTISGDDVAVLAVTATGTNATLLTKRPAGTRWIAERPRELRDASARAITTTPTGTFVGGCATRPDRTSQATVWTTQDLGAGWTSTRLEGSNACVWGFARLGDMLAAVGEDGDSAAVWSSADGSTWSREQPVEAFAGRVGAVAVAASAIGDTWLVAGTDLGPVDGDAPELLAVWRRSSE